MSSTLRGYNSKQGVWQAVPETDRNKEVHLLHPISELEPIVTLDGKVEIALPPSEDLKDYLKKIVPELDNFKLVGT